MIKLTKDIERTEEGRFWFERTELKVAEAIKLACDYLVNTLGVHDFKLLPYENMIAMLAVFFYANNRAQPSRTQREQIRRWFWYTAVVQRFAGSGYESNIIEDRDFFMRLGKARKGNYSLGEKASLQSLKMANYQAGSALSRAFKLLLHQNKPRYVTNGEPMRAGAGGIGHEQTRPASHIRPERNWKRRTYLGRNTNNLCNICLLVAHDKSVVWQPIAVGRYLAEFLSHAIFSPRDEEPPDSPRQSFTALGHTRETRF